MMSVLGASPDDHSTPDLSLMARLSEAIDDLTSDGISCRVDLTDGSVAVGVEGEGSQYSATASPSGFAIGYERAAEVDVKLREAAAAYRRGQKGKRERPLGSAPVSLTQQQAAQPRRGRGHLGL